MQELHINKENVLGINASNLGPEKSLALSIEAMHSHELNIVYFLSASSSLYCQETPWAMELVNSFAMVLPGDRSTEMAVQHQLFQGENSLGEFIYEYLKGLLSYMQKESKDLFVVTPTRERLTSFLDYLAGEYPDISVSGMVYEQDEEGAADKVVNEINALIPDSVLLLLPPRQQLTLLRDYESMINAGLCICIESLQPLLTEETRAIPSWIRALHLEPIYRWFHKEEKLESTIKESLFRKKITEESMMDTEQDEQKKC